MIERGVLYIVDATSNSVKQHVLALVKYLNRARYKPYLAISDDTFLEEHIKHLGVEYVVVPEIATANKMSVGSAVKQIQGFIADYTVNLVHSHDYQACFVGAQVANALNVKHICTIHSANGIAQKKKGFFAVQNDKIVTMPNHLITVSGEVKKAVEGLNQKVSMIYNGIEAERFAETLDTEHLFRELGITKENTLVGTITRLVPEKGTAVFLEAAARLYKNDPSMHFVVAGDGPESDDLKKKAASLGLTDNVHFLGFRRDVAHILKSLDVVVIPNLTTGVPMVLLESLASKRPVVVSDVAGVREVIAEDSVDFVAPGDVDAIVSAVEELLSDRDKATSKANAGQKIVSDCFPVEKMVKATQSLYLEVAG